MSLPSLHLRRRDGTVPVNFIDPAGTNAMNPDRYAMQCNFPIEGMPYVCWWYPVGGGGSSSAGPAPDGPPDLSPDRLDKYKLITASGSSAGQTEVC